MTWIIARAALEALGLFGASFHEPFHAKRLSCTAIVLLYVTSPTARHLRPCPQRQLTQTSGIERLVSAIGKSKRVGHGGCRIDSARATAE